jgi:hypothetical protein
MSTSAKAGRWWLLWGVCYLAMLATVVWWLYAARDWAQAELTKPESAVAWEAWREDVRADQTRPAPVQRRVPKSIEPPALVLTRDYFGVLMTGAVLFSSLLYGVVAWFVTGIISTRQDAAATFAIDP